MLANITAKSDVGSYNYAGGSPHAISSITGVADGLINPLFQYDANGNLLCMSTSAACSGTVGRQVTYTSGSAVAISDASDAASAINSYDEFGIPGTSNAGCFQYTGQVWLPDVGACYSRLASIHQLWIASSKLIRLATKIRCTFALMSE